MRTKKCSNCFKTKPVEEFYRKLHSYQSRCKECNPQVVKGYKNRLDQKKRDEYFMPSSGPISDDERDFECRKAQGIL